MPIEVGIWKLGEKLQRVTFSTIESESKLEQILCEDLSLLSPQLMLIGRQVPTDFGKFIDILAMDGDGDLTIVELKRDKTPREVVAQSLDYASWVQNLSYEQIAEVYANHHSGKPFEEGFADVFGTGPPEKLNESHNLVIVASELDSSTERIINYLADNYGVPINAVFFRYFQEGGNEYLTRTWLIDPQDAEVKTAKAAAKKDREPWNGRDFYVRFVDESENGIPCRTWEDARRYGFISGDGSSWIGRTLNGLFLGARVFVNVAQCGYAGVGIVKEMARPIHEFNVALDGDDLPIVDAPLAAFGMHRSNSTMTNNELIVRVEWIKTVPKAEGYWEKGLFAAGHTACRLRNRFTLERLTQHFGLTD